MDIKERPDRLAEWSPTYFDLDTVSDFLSQYRDETAPHKVPVSELMATWAFAKFLSDITRIQYVVGVPAKLSIEQVSLNDFVCDRCGCQNLYFDTLIANKANQKKEYYKIQVKRLYRKTSFDAGLFISEINRMTKKYGDCQDLNMLFWIQTGLRISIDQLRNDLQQRAGAALASMWLFSMLSRKDGIQAPSFIQVYPNDGRLPIWTKAD